MEIHDSSVDHITMENGIAVIHFPCVYIHQSEGKPTQDDGTFWAQEAILRIGDAQIEGTFSVAKQVWGGDIVYLYDGSLRLDDVISDDLIPIPLNMAAEVELAMECCGETVRIRGTSVHLELIGEARFVEEYKAKG